MSGDLPGFALRFPRIISFRTEDKKSEDATVIREIREMFKATATATAAVEGGSGHPRPSAAANSSRDRISSLS